VACPLWSAAEAVLDARYVRGSISISLGDALAFVLTLWASFLLSSFVRFVLGEDVYSRVGLPRGASYAVSRLVHYAVVLGGFLVVNVLRRFLARRRALPRDGEPVPAEVVPAEGGAA
jgi:small-conductance mechanosensitive channel